MRDMTQKQFEDALERGGFKRAGFMGYYRLPEPFSAVSVSAWNAGAGASRRLRLSYLHSELRKQEKRAK